MSTKKRRARTPEFAAAEPHQSEPGLPEPAAEPVTEPGAASESEPESSIEVRALAGALDLSGIERARALEAEDHEAAQSVYRELILSAPGDIEARLGLALLHDRLGQQQQALEQLEAAREQEPENAVVLTQLGAVLGALGRFQDAERELRRAVRLAPERADAFLALGTLCFKRGLYLQAEQELARALEHDTTLASAYYYRGEALHQLDRIDEAVVMLLRAVDLDPRNARAYHTLGILYDRKHMRAEAALMYRKGREAGSA